MENDEKRKKLDEAYESMDFMDKVNLYNVYAENNNYEQAFSADDIEKMYPLSSFEDVQSCFQFYSSVLNDVGNPKYDYVIVNGSGYLNEFNESDIDKDALLEAVETGDIDYRDLPSDLADVMDEIDDKEMDL